MDIRNLDSGLLLGALNDPNKHLTISENEKSFKIVIFKRKLSNNSIKVDKTKDKDSNVKHISFKNEHQHDKMSTPKSVQYRKKCNYESLVYKDIWIERKETVSNISKCSEETIREAKTQPSLKSVLSERAPLSLESVLSESSKSLYTENASGTPSLTDSSLLSENCKIRKCNSFMNAESVIERNDVMSLISLDEMNDLHRTVPKETGENLFGNNSTRKAIYATCDELEDTKTMKNNFKHSETEHICHDSAISVPSINLDLREEFCSQSITSIQNSKGTVPQKSIETKKNTSQLMVKNHQEKSKSNRERIQSKKSVATKSKITDRMENLAVDNSEYEGALIKVLLSGQSYEPHSKVSNKESRNPIIHSVKVHLVCPCGNNQNVSDDEEDIIALLSESKLENQQSDQESDHFSSRYYQPRTKIFDPCQIRLKKHNRISKSINLRGNYMIL